jgi:hypothetical protein
MTAQKAAKRLTVRVVSAERPLPTQSHSSCVTAQMKRLLNTIRVLRLVRRVRRTTTPIVRLGNVVGLRLRNRPSFDESWFTH